MLTHSHSLLVSGPSVLGTHLLKFANQLTTNEIELIQGLGRYNLPSGKVREIAEHQNPGRMYSDNLLYRLMDRGRRLFLGSDRDSMSKFFDLCYNVRASGGSFEYDLDTSMTLKSIILQSVAMATYSKAYPDFILCDGTHNVSKYTLKLMPFTVVDSLGRNTICGIALDQSENTEIVKQSLRVFGLNIPGATFMTDGGSAYPNVAIECNMIHVLCTKHFEKEIVANCSGLGPLAADYRRECFALIYDNMTPDDCDRRLSLALATFAQSDRACKSHKKQELRKFNLFQLFEHLVQLFTRQQTKALDELVATIMTKAEWSSYVEKRWRASYSIMHEWSFVHCDGDMWYVSDVPLVDVTEARHHIELNSAEAFPTCNCYDFLSSMIPCVGICQQLNVTDPHGVDDAYQLSPPSAASSNHSVSLDVYKKVHVPTSGAMRITKFRNACSRIEQQVANNSHLYRLFMANLAAFENGIGDETVRGSLEPFHLPQDAALIPTLRPEAIVGNATGVVRPPVTSSSKKRKFDNVQAVELSSSIQNRSTKQK
ncbi:hypothetical protein H257_07289 [Aphanomyces astaci]|uniref:ZSWIM1/3 RNaseH-like domain-containing protein n=1 Tax=Aphanomyces astaci TaxID=112090 RepID=W4GHT0_APHAT|nr:hypothetical protein H257_07289 [Aphanomyces astaci]ETV79222.1 hypothetical protein H257_07289 [Aphanomyces astaci]|eukprot:XP_009831063.1 hypothetical protein H257_07289 [Aphanomyces astaci]